MDGRLLPIISQPLSGRAVGSAENFLLSPRIIPEIIIPQRCKGRKEKQQPGNHRLHRFHRLKKQKQGKRCGDAWHVSQREQGWEKISLRSV